MTAATEVMNMRILAFVTAICALITIPIGMKAQQGKALLINVRSGLFLGAGNNGGTRASLLPYSEYQTLHQNGSTYTLETQVGNGDNNFYFDGDYMDGQPTNLTITNKGNGYSTIASGSNYFGYSSTAGSYQGSYILGKNLNASNNGALWEIVFQSDFYNHLSEATMDYPVDATFLILNPNFGRNNRNTNAWTIEANNHNLCGGSNDNKCAESWCSAFTLSQTLNKVMSYVPNGIYCLTAQAALTDYTNKYDGAEYPVIFANEESSPFRNMEGSDIGSNMSKLSTAFADGKYQIEPIFFDVTDGKITIGARGTRIDTWCTWDNFRLTYYGKSTYTGIHDHQRPSQPDGRIFNLRGQQVHSPTKGIYIINGKKVAY